MVNKKSDRRLRLRAFTYARRRLGLGSMNKVDTGIRCADYLKIDPPKGKSEADQVILRFYNHAQALTTAQKKSAFPKWRNGRVERRDVANPDSRPYEATDEFLESFQWRKLRMEILKEQGARCSCCGATPKDGLRMHVDHIKPRRTHPELALVKSNLQVLCEVCNHGKGNWDQTDWRTA